MPCNFPFVHHPVPLTGLMPLTPDLDVDARRLVLEANFRPFITQTHEMLRSYGKKASQDDLAKILIMECIEAGYVTESRISRIALGSPVPSWYVITVLHRESRLGQLWLCDNDERYRLTPDA